MMRLASMSRCQRDVNNPECKSCTERSRMRMRARPMALRLHQARKVSPKRIFRKEHSAMATTKRSEGTMSRAGKAVKQAAKTVVKKTEKAMKPVAEAVGIK